MTGITKMKSLFHRTFRLFATFTAEAIVLSSDDSSMFSSHTGSEQIFGCRENFPLFILLTKVVSLLKDAYHNVNYFYLTLVAVGAH